VRRAARSRDCSANGARASSGAKARRKKVADRHQVDRKRINLAGMPRDDAVLVGRKIGESADVIPYRLVRRVKQIAP